MVKKGLLALVGLVIMSTFYAWAASTWQLQSKLSTSGGTIKVRNNPLQTTVGSLVFTNFTTSAPVPVLVSANPGYNISGLTRSGSAIPLGNYTSHYESNFLKSTGTSQSLLASFAVKKYLVSATATGPGSITPASVTVSHGGSTVLSAAPNSQGCLLTGVTGGSVTDTAGNPVTLPFAGSVKITVSNVTAPQTVSAVFATFSVSAGVSQTALLNSTVSLSGSMVGGGTPVWAQVSGPSATLAGATTLNPSFTPASTGSYVFQLTQYIGSMAVASATTQVNVVGSLSGTMKSSCMGCHAADGAYPAPQVFVQWSSSNHKVTGISCVTCHTAGEMPTPVNHVTVDRSTFTINAASAGTVGGNFCVTCHNPDIVTAYQASLHRNLGVVCVSCHKQAPHKPDTSSAVCGGCHFDTAGHVIGHPFVVDSGAVCTTCHNPHNPRTVEGSFTGNLVTLHFNNVTGANYPASYITSRSSCSNCHFDSPANKTARHQWYSSAHANTTSPAWAGSDFKTKSGCVQCHTTTGFIAYSTGKVSAAWGVASDKTKELLTCIGCHQDVSAGIVRTLKPVRPYADDSYLNRETGKSNICMNCHSGRNSGASITAQLAVADFSNLPFIDPHYRAAGGVLHGSAGYPFSGGSSFNYYSSNSHRGIGMASGAGPCVACHKSTVSGHIFTAQANEVCAGCHRSYLDAAQLAAKKAAFANGLNVLKAMLAAKQHPYSEQYPHFADTNWGSGQAGADTMGAAFNYALLLGDPGAYAHNSAYTKELLVKSIDFLYNGTVTGSIDTALSYLVNEGKITPEAAQSLAAYQASGSCTSCHTNTSGSHSKHLNGGFSCIDCHARTAASNGTILPGSTAHLNGSVDLEPGPGRTFSYTSATGGGTCSAISCHNNGSATWGGTLGCDGCHGAPPATPSHLKHFGGAVTQAAYGSTGIAQDLGATADAYIMNCGNCHPMDKAKHGNGKVDIELYNPLAPAGSLKAKHPASASYVAGTTLFQDDRGIAYSKGTCSNVYCHSYKSWTTPTGVPDTASCNPSVPADLVTTTNYKTVTWDGPSLDCSGCHANPPRTRAPENGGAAGDSHSWIGPDNGYGPIEFMHTSNMLSQAYSTPYPDPISCRYCHSGTVSQNNSYSYDMNDPAYPTIMGNVPITNFANHVNGRNDVVFEKQVAVPPIMDWSNQRLTNATYDPATKTCSNVICHPLRTNIKWGTPYKGENDYDCARCHNFGATCPDADAQLSREPSITSMPPTMAAPGYAYSYSVFASEPGAGALSYTLTSAPDGMSVSSAGVISWTPRTDQMGSFPVRLVVGSVASSNLLVAIQEFTVTVQYQPIITTTPPTTTSSWSTYNYQALADVPSGMPAPSYALTSSPTGMTIGASTGSISWIPTDTQTGSFPVSLTVTSGGYSATQNFTLQVSPTPIVFTSTPVTTASTQVAYRYTVTASLTGTTTFGYRLLTTVTGMSINSSTGVISWTPSASQAGSFPVTVQVAGGAYTNRQSFTVVSTASPITITSTPVTTAKVGTAYSYPVAATMPGGGTFTYALPTKPAAAMTISTAGVISWTPTSTYVGSRAVTVTVTRGASSASQSFNINVAP